jgi:hypothetical protein
MPDSNAATSITTPEQAIGCFVIGFVGDPPQVLDDDKWRLYDALLDAGNLLGELVASATAELGSRARFGRTRRRPNELKSALFGERPPDPK